MISKETFALINTFKNPLLEKLTDIKKEVTYFFDDGILNYVQNFKDKYEYTKTFLFRNEKVNFYDTFYPVTLRNSKKKINFNDLEELFKETNFLSIIGNAGSGKSMLMKHIFLLSIKQIFQVPIVIELRNLNHYEGSFTSYIHEIITDKSLAPTKKILDRILDNGNFLFLLDGYDEIYSERKQKISNDIEKFTDKYHKNLFILTSRPGANAESFPRFDSCYVKPLTTTQIKEFTKKQLENIEEGQLADKIIDVIDKPENKEYSAYLSSPLLLSMFIMTFKSYPELPKLKSKFYWNVYDTLCTKHDTFTKHGGYQHERISGLQNDDISKILEWFSYISLFEGNYNFDEQYFKTTLNKILEKIDVKCDTDKIIQDLVVAISIIIIDGLEYKFPHKSLQEYFAAMLISSLTKENKEKIYTIKFGSLKDLTHGGNLNFWDLCNELDSICFNRYFVLHHLRELIKNIDESSKESIVYSFFKYLGFGQGLKLKDGSTTYEFNSYSYYGIPIESIMPYLKLGSYARLSLESYKKSQERIKILIDNNYLTTNRVEDKNETAFRLDYVSKWDKLLYSFVDSVGLADYIIDLTEKVKSEIKLIENNLETQEKNTVSLLDI